MKIRKFNESKEDSSLYDALENIKDILNISDDDIEIKHPDKDNQYYTMSEMDDISYLMEEWSSIIIRLYDSTVVYAPKDSSEDVFNKSIKFFKNLIRINNTLPKGWKLASEYTIDLSDDKILISLIKE